MYTSFRVVFCCLIALIVSVSGATETTRWLPAAASNPGLQGTMWTTDIWLYNNVFDSENTVFLAFLPDTTGTVEPEEVQITLPPLGQVEIHDVVNTLFGENRAGAIRMRAEHRFEVQSRTFNSGSGTGTFGQGIAAVPSPASSGEGVVLLGASNDPSDDGVRTNLGVLNPNPETVHVLVFVSGPTTSDLLGFTHFAIGPFGWWQGNVFELIDHASEVVETAWVYAISDDPELAIIPYLSRVDNASGDGTYIQGLDGQSEYTRPVDWTIEIAITAPNATVDSLTVTIADGESQVFEDPDETVTLTAEDMLGPFTTCWSVEGTSPADSWTSVKVDVLATAENDMSHHYTRSEGVSGDFVISDCDKMAPQFRP